jgi:hypothetical protein
MSLTFLEPIIVNTAATFTFANANVTSNLAAGNITITGVYTGNGSGLTNLPGANITGTVANANFANTAGTVTTNAQPNITSVGTLSTLNVSGFSTFYASQDRFSVINGATGIVTHDLANGGVFYHTSPVANFTPNFTNVPTTNNYTTVVVLFIAQGDTPYLPIDTGNVQISGANVTIKWGGGAAPTGTANGVDMVSFSLIRNAGTWVVLGQAGGFS